MTEPAKMGTGTTPHNLTRIQLGNVSCTLARMWLGTLTRTTRHGTGEDTAYSKDSAGQCATYYGKDMVGRRVAYSGKRK